MLWREAKLQCHQSDGQVLDCGGIQPQWYSDLEYQVYNSA